MKNVIVISLLSFVVFSCKPKQEDDVYLYLTQEQKAFITTVHAGDTAIWKSDGGLKDTGIIKPIVYQRRFRKEYDNPKISIEDVSYDYRFVGIKKLYTDHTISVQTLPNSANLLQETALCDGSVTRGIIPSKLFGGVAYSNVFWTTYTNGTDTVFWNSKGFLGAYHSGVRIEKIR